MLNRKSVRMTYIKIDRRLDMKFLKFLLVLVLLTLLTLLGGVIFSNKIIYSMTRTKNSEFRNLKYSIIESEISFENFVVNGKSLGRGKAKLDFIREGFLGLSPKVKVASLKLDKVDFKALYSRPDEKIDSFMGKLDTPSDEEILKKTSEEFAGESSKSLEMLKENMDKFLNGDVKNQITAINKIKTDYGSLSDLKEKAQKVVELDKVVKPVIVLINSERENVDKAVSKIEIERSMMFSGISESLTKLEKQLSLNDVNNMNSYIFLDKGKEIAPVLAKSLKTVNIIREIKALPLGISEIDMNDGAVKFSGSSGEILIDESLRISVKENDGVYELDYKGSEIAVMTSYGEKINSVIEYIKGDILDGKKVKLVSEFVFDKGNFQEINKTALSEEEKVQLAERISNLRETRYKEIMTKYEEQTKNIEVLIADVEERKSKLDKIQKELLSLTSITVLDNVPEGTDTSTSPSQNNQDRESQEGESEVR